MTTTAGNTTTRRTAANAAWVLTRCGVTDVPVAAGRAEPVTTPETHGEHGLGYVTALAPGSAAETDWKKLARILHGKSVDRAADVSATGFPVTA